MDWTIVVVGLVAFAAGLLVGVRIGDSPWRGVRGTDVDLDFWRVPSSEPGDWSDWADAEEWEEAYGRHIESNSKRAELAERLAERRG